MKLNEIFARIHQHDLELGNAEANEIRLALGEKIRECLIARGDVLTQWERANLAIAIDLLPSPWLGLTWGHVNLACSSDNAAGERREREPPKWAKAPISTELHATLTDALTPIRRQSVAISDACTRSGPLDILWSDYMRLGIRQRGATAAIER